MSRVSRWGTLTVESERSTAMAAGNGPGRGDKGGSAGSKNGPGTKNNGWSGKAPPKGNGGKGGNGK